MAAADLATWMPNRDVHGCAEGWVKNCGLKRQETHREVSTLLCLSPAPIVQQQGTTFTNTCINKLNYDFTSSVKWVKQHLRLKKGVQTVETNVLPAYLGIYLSHTVAQGGLQGAVSKCGVGEARNLPQSKVSCVPATSPLEQAPPAEIYPQTKLS